MIALRQIDLYFTENIRKYKYTSWLGRSLRIEGEFF